MLNRVRRSAYAKTACYKGTMDPGGENSSEMELDISVSNSSNYFAEGMNQPRLDDLSIFVYHFEHQSEPGPQLCQCET